jgi:hypothetical protein
MNREDLEQYVWDHLPARKLLVGRARVNRIVGTTLRGWPVPVLRQCDAAEGEVVGKYMARSIERQERAEYGMGFFAAIILSAIIGEIVKILIRRWFESSEARLAIVEAGR